VPIFGDAKIFCSNVNLFPNNVQKSLNVKAKAYHCKQIKVSACLITVHSLNISNKSIWTFSRASATFHVQI